MLKIGKLTDYAVAVTGALARNDAAASASVLAQHTALPEPTVAKVLKLLAKSGLVVSQRGAAGGYRLARPAAEISVASLVAAIEGPIELVACVDGKAESCCHSRTCPSQGKWDKVNTAVRVALEEISLSEMFDRPRLVTMRDSHVDRP